MTVADEMIRIRVRSDEIMVSAKRGGVLHESERMLRDPDTIWAGPRSDGCIHGLRQKMGELEGCDGRRERRETKVWSKVDRRQASGIGHEALFARTVARPSEVGSAKEAAVQFAILSAA